MAELPPLREVIERHGLDARKALGQNFLLDLNLTGRIARAAGDISGHVVYEVGPGPGGLSRALLDAGAKKLVAVERDRRCIAALAEIAAHYPGRVEIIEGDAMTVDAAALIGPGPSKIVANLPYNIGTALLVGWLTAPSWPPFWDGAILMFQREVAERITAKPGSKAYGRLSILAQWRSRAKKLFDIPARAFTPPPKVTSAVVEIIPTAPLREVSIKSLEIITAAAFNQRRKMLRAALRSLPVAADALLEAAGIEPTARAEEIPVEGFLALAAAYEVLRQAAP